jgi:branched-chain amino acid aminotransferase
MSDRAPQPPALAIEPHPARVPDADRAGLIADPGFGRVFTDHMASAAWSADDGWHDARITPRVPLQIDPATSVLHYAQEIFEGMKAYRTADGTLALFRPRDNARRFNASARRMAMPELPEDLFLEAVRRVVATDAEWFPGVPGGALYIRPFMFSSDVRLGVRPASEYRFLVIVSPVGNYFRGDPTAIKLWVSRNYVRAAPGGTGEAKCGGNYAASLVAQAEAIDRGCDQVVFLDAIERRWVEELGGMNLFFVMDDGALVTPPLGGTILPGITRDSLIAIARDEGLTVREERYSIDQWRADAASGALVESFACGTAAVVTPVGQVYDGDTVFTIGTGDPGPLTQRLRQRLVDIQYGRAPDRHGWIESIG